MAAQKKGEGNRALTDTSWIKAFISLGWGVVFGWNTFWDFWFGELLHLLALTATSTGAKSPSLPVFRSPGRCHLPGFPSQGVFVGVRRDPLSFCWAETKGSRVQWTKKPWRNKWESWNFCKVNNVPQKNKLENFVVNLRWKACGFLGRSWS